MDSSDALSRSCYRELRLNKKLTLTFEYLYLYFCTWCLSTYRYVYLSRLIWIYDIILLHDTSFKFQVFPFYRQLRSISRLHSYNSAQFLHTLIGTSGTPCVPTSSTTVDSQCCSQADTQVTSSRSHYTYMAEWLASPDWDRKVAGSNPGVARSDGQRWNL